MPRQIDTTDPHSSPAQEVSGARTRRDGTSTRARVTSAESQESASCLAVFAVYHASFCEM